MAGKRCRENCFECRLPDCIYCGCDNSWEREFNRMQRKNRRERKKTAKAAEAPGYGTLLSLRLR